MRNLISALSAAVVLGAVSVAAPAVSQEPSAVRRDARESPQLGLLGVWRADIEASTYPGAAPQEHIRSFQYTADGRVMVAFITRSAQGEISSGHWAVTLDGQPGYEYFHSNGATPYAVITLMQADENTFNLTAGRWGEVHSTSVYTLSEDGETLTLVRQSDGRQSTVVYRRW